VPIRPILIAALLMLAPAANAQSPPEPNLEQQVLAGINQARANPVAYAETLRRYRGYFDGNVAHLPGTEVGLRTQEGVAAVDDAIAFLARQKPLPPLQGSPALAAAARELAADQALTGATGHTGSDGSNSRDRIRRQGGGGVMAETLSYGANDAAGVVRQLIVDDGVPGRGHRKILFGKKYRLAGVACGSHLHNRSICVIDLASFIGPAQAPKQAPVPPPDIDIQ
jgi:uncharacterized protein YkwD